MIYSHPRYHLRNKLPKSGNLQDFHIPAKHVYTQEQFRFNQSFTFVKLPTIMGQVCSHDQSIFTNGLIKSISISSHIIDFQLKINMLYNHKTFLLQDKNGYVLVSVIKTSTTNSLHGMQEWGGRESNSGWQDVSLLSWTTKRPPH